MVPTAKDASVFMAEIKKCMDNSSLRHLPPLIVWVYTTREKTAEQPMIAGRPDFPSIFKTVSGAHPGKAALVFACGPSIMVQEIWDQTVKLSKKGERFDFCHEVFEF